ncbi:MAG: dihydropteroate synthase [Acidiferrobacterales bacterium]
MTEAARKPAPKPEGRRAGPVLDCAGRSLDLGRAAIMGILNVTPDSFSDGGVFFDLDRAVGHALAMVEQGADIIDIGGESTRPGAEPVSVEKELERVIPVVRALHEVLPVPISIDTCKPEVMRAAASAGAGMINDVMALRAPGAIEAARDSGLPVCLMHMQGVPRSMQHHPRYQDVVIEVTDFLEGRIEACLKAGIGLERIVADPGFGFGKNLGHNLELLRRLGDFNVLRVPILVGLSRKSMIGAALDLPVERRLHASVALALWAVQNGAHIVRVHDVGPTRDAIRMLETVAYHDETESLSVH